MVRQHNGRWRINANERNGSRKCSNDRCRWDAAGACKHATAVGGGRAAVKVALLQGEERLRQETARAHQALAAQLQGQSSADPNRAENVPTQPDEQTQDPAQSAVAPPATGQEPQNTSAVVNQSAADRDLQNLLGQLEGDGGAGAMGQQQNLRGATLRTACPRHPRALACLAARETSRP